CSSPTISDASPRRPTSSAITSTFLSKPAHQALPLLIVAAVHAIVARWWVCAGREEGCTKVAEGKRGVRRVSEACGDTGSLACRRRRGPRVGRCGCQVR